MTNYNDGNWHGWNGGECPVDDDSIVEGVYLRDGAPAPETPVTDRAAHFDWPRKAANTLVAFRVVKEYVEPPKPREWWAVGKHLHDSYDEAAAFRLRCHEIFPTGDHLNTPIVHVIEVKK